MCKGAFDFRIHKIPVKSINWRTSKPRVLTTTAAPSATTCPLCPPCTCNCAQVCETYTPRARLVPPARPPTRPPIMCKSEKSKSPSTSGDNSGVGGVQINLNHGNEVNSDYAELPKQHSWLPTGQIAALVLLGVAIVVLVVLYVCRENLRRAYFDQHSEETARRADASDNRSNAQRFGSLLRRMNTTSTASAPPPPAAQPMLPIIMQAPPPPVPPHVPHNISAAWQPQASSSFAHGANFTSDFTSGASAVSLGQNATKTTHT